MKMSIKIIGKGLKGLERRTEKQKVKRGEQALKRSPHVHSRSKELYRRSEERVSELKMEKMSKWEIGYYLKKVSLKRCHIKISQKGG